MLVNFIFPRVFDSSYTIVMPVVENLNDGKHNMLLMETPSINIRHIFTENLNVYVLWCYENINLICCIITAYFFQCFFILQVWYLLGWLYYLQLEKPSAAEDSESLKKSARIYLTKAKKVMLRKHKYLRPSVYSFLFSRYLHSAGFVSLLLLRHKHTLLGLVSGFFFSFLHTAVKFLSCRWQTRVMKIKSWGEWEKQWESF